MSAILFFSWRASWLPNARATCSNCNIRIGPDTAASGPSTAPIAASWPRWRRPRCKRGPAVSSKSVSSGGRSRSASAAPDPKNRPRRATASGRRGAGFSIADLSWPIVFGLPRPSGRGQGRGQRTSQPPPDRSRAAAIIAAVRTVREVCGSQVLANRKASSRHARGDTRPFRRVHRHKTAIRRTARCRAVRRCSRRTPEPGRVAR